MPTIKQKPQLDLSNFRTFTDKDRKINKPVKYNVKKNQLQAKTPLARLGLRIKAAITGTSSSKLVQKSVREALQKYDMYHAKVADKKDWKQANPQVTNAEKTKSVLKTIDQAHSKAGKAAANFVPGKARNYFQSEESTAHSHLDNYKDSEPIAESTPFVGSTFKPNDDEPIYENVSQKDKKTNEPIYENVKKSNIDPNELHDDDDESDFSEFDDYDDEPIYEPIEQKITPERPPSARSTGEKNRK